MEYFVIYSGIFYNNADWNVSQNFVSLREINFNYIMVEILYIRARSLSHQCRRDLVRDNNNPFILNSEKLILIIRFQKDETQISRIVFLTLFHDDNRRLACRLCD